MANWVIFKCKNCKKIYKEKWTKQQDANHTIDAIGGYSFRSTHNCRENVRGVGECIGAVKRTRKQEVGE